MICFRSRIGNNPLNGGSPQNNNHVELKKIPEIYLAFKVNA
jgi:hypothetical protein